MPLKESRLTNGTLTLTPTGTGAVAMSFDCQVTNVRLTSAYSDDGDTVHTLCGDTVPAPRKLDGHKLEGTIVQDFDPAGTLAFLWEHELEVVDFSYTPNDVTTTPVITGTLQIEVPSDSYGGDVNKRITSDFAWNIQTGPTFGTAGGASSSSTKAEKAAA